MPASGHSFEYGLLHPNDDSEEWSKPGVTNHPESEGGRVTVPDGPGLDYDVDRDQVESSRVDA